MEQTWQFFRRAQSWFGAAASPRGRFLVTSLMDGQGTNQTLLFDTGRGHQTRWANQGWAVASCCSDTGLTASVIVSPDGTTHLAVRWADVESLLPVPSHTYALTPVADAVLGIGLGDAESMVVAWSPDTELRVAPLPLSVQSVVGVHEGAVLLNGSPPGSDEPPALFRLDPRSLAAVPDPARRVGLTARDAMLVWADPSEPTRVNITDDRGGTGSTLDLQDRRGSCEVCAVSGDGGKLLVAFREGLGDDLWLFDLVTERSRRLNPPGTGTTGTASFGPDDRSVSWVETSPAAGPSLVRLDLDQGSSCRALIRGDRAPWPQQVEQMTTGDPEIQSLVLRPGIASAPPTIVVALHGGPRVRWRMKYEQLLQLAVAAGCLVAAPNCRGSAGYDPTFTDGLHGYWGERDVADLEAVVSELRRRSPEARILGLGQSYGSFLGVQAALARPRLWDGLVLSSSFLDPESLAASGGPALQASLHRQGAIPSRTRRGTEGSLPHLPVWVLHGSEDHVVPISNGERVHQELRRAGAAAKFLRVAGVGHQAFEGSRELHEWLFELLRAPDWLDDATNRGVAFTA